MKVTPSAPGYLSSPGTITLLDDDVPALALTFRDTVVSKGAVNPATQATLTMNTVLTQSVTVVLATPSPAITLPLFLTLAAGQTNVSFRSTSCRDNLVTGTRVAAIGAHFLDNVTGVPLPQGVTNSISVTDNNGPALAVTLAAGVIREGWRDDCHRDAEHAAHQRARCHARQQRPQRRHRPATVTIANGATSATFPVNGVNPGFPTGSRIVGHHGGCGRVSGTGVASLNVSDINLADLVIGKLTLPAAGLSGSNVTVSYVVANHGIAAASGVWLDTLSYSYSPTATARRKSARLFIPPRWRWASLTRTPRPSRSPYSLDPIYIVAQADVASSVDEADFANNTATSTNSISISPYYRATVQADIHQGVSPASRPNARARVSGQQSVATVAERPGQHPCLVERHPARFQCQRRPDGNFTYTFQPIPGEAGQYDICADYPYVDQDTIQDSFDLYGMRITDQQASLTLYPGHEHHRPNDLAQPRRPALDRRDRLRLRTAGRRHG